MNVVSICQPVELLDRTMAAMRASWMVVADSGGLQEAAPGPGKPVLVLRAMTERPEAIAGGAVELAGTNGARILQAIKGLYRDASAYGRMAKSVFPYGDGKAADRIVEAMRQRIGIADG